MSAISITGSDTIILSGRVLNDLADGDVGSITFPNTLVEAKVGKNGTTLFALNETGKTVEMSLRVVRGSADDKFLNGEIQSFLADPAAYTLIDGSFTKRSGDGQGNVSSEQYTMNGGIVRRYPDASQNVEGNTDQSVSVYQLIFPNTERGFE